MALNTFTKRSLQKLLWLVFAAIVIPIGALIWHAYQQLSWESFHQYRTFAEELSMRIDQGLSELIAVEEARSHTEFSFFSSEQSENTADLISLKRSPLSVFLPDGEPAGILGYFQIDQAGLLESPLLPDAAKLQESGIAPSELNDRREIVTTLRGILNNNQLIELPLESTAGADLSANDAVTDEIGSLQAETSATQQYSEQISNAEAPADKLDSQVAFDRLNKAPESISGALVKQKERSRQSLSELEFDSSYERKSEDFGKKEPVPEP